MSTMSLQKAHRLITYLTEQGERGGTMRCSGGGEIAWSFSSQQPQHVHEFLLKYGFVYVDQEYIYRPYTRRT